MGEDDFQGSILLTDNPMTDQSYVEAMPVFQLMQMTSPAIAMADLIISMMMEPMLEP
jgi:hypothetical protein